MCQSSTNAAWRNRAAWELSFSVCDNVFKKGKTHFLWVILTDLVLLFNTLLFIITFVLNINKMFVLCFGKAKDMLSETVSKWSITQHWDGGIFCTFFYEHIQVVFHTKYVYYINKLKIKKIKN